jgi:hypothetical protein
VEVALHLDSVQRVMEKAAIAATGWCGGRAKDDFGVQSFLIDKEGALYILAMIAVVCPILLSFCFSPKNLLTKEKPR